MRNATQRREMNVDCFAIMACEAMEKNCRRFLSTNVLKIHMES